MKRFNELKIARQIGLAQFLMGVAIATVIVIISISLFYNMVTDSVHTQIQLSADHTVAKLERNYESVMKISEVIQEYVVQSIDVSKVNNQEYIDAFKENLDPVIRTLAQESSIGNTAYFYFNPELTGQANDIYYADENLDGLVEKQNEIALSMYEQDSDTEDMAWWFQPVLTKSSYWTLPYTWEWDNGEKKQFVSYTQPVYVDGILIGVAGADMLYDRIQMIVNEGFDEEYGYVYLLNDRYQVLIHPRFDESVSLFSLHDGYYEFLYDNLDSGYVNVFEYTRDDQSLRLGALRNLNNGWILGLSVDFYEAYSILTDYIIGVVASLMVIIIVAIVISNRIGNSITKPLTKVTELIDEDESVHQIPLSLLEREDEIGILVSKIVEYKKQIQDDYVEIVSKNEALLESLDKQKELERDLQIMVEVIGSSKEGIFIVDENGMTIFKNKSFDEAFGIDDTDLNIFEDVLELEPYMLRQIEREKSFNAEKILKRFTGESYPAMLYITVVDVGHKFYLGIIQDVSESRAREKRIERLRFYDPLTSLMNKQRIHQIVNEGIIDGYFEKGIGAMIIINLDDFRIINEAMGYEQSNIVLTKIANRLNEIIAKGDYLARVTGDEFMIFTPNHDDVVEIQSKVDDIFKSFKTPLNINNEELFVSVSMGISLYPLDGTNFEMLLTSASSALNHVKNSLKNAYGFFNTDINEATKETYDLMTFLRKALDINAFSVVYQPQYNMISREIIGVEALLRLTYDGKPVSPTKFIPLLEKANLITHVGEFVINESLKLVKDLEKKGRKVPVSVNISGVQFKCPYLINLTKKMLSDHDVDPSLLKYEITEGILLNDVKEAQELIEELHELGVKVAIDDFGTGYSSLAYLKVFNIDCLKIDRAFIMEYPNQDDGHIARAIISLAESLNLSIIAEGVETNDQAEFLVNNHCVNAQGYLYSKPVPYQKIIEKVKVEDNI